MHHIREDLVNITLWVGFIALLQLGVELFNIRLCSFLGGNINVALREVAG